MRLFKRKEKVSPVADKVAGKIAGVIIYVQQKFSKGMGKIVSGMTIQKVKLWLIIFCVFSGGLSVYFIVSSLVAQPDKPIKIERLRMPVNLNRSGEEGLDATIPGDIYQQIQDYKHYMDSLGEPIRKSLLDSMTILEQIYLQQQK